MRTILPRCWLDEAKCAPGIEALRHYRRSFNDRTANFSTRPVHDWTSHAADGFRYFAVGFRPPGDETRPPRTHNDYNPFGGTHGRP